MNEQQVPPHKMTKDQLKLLALTQRIGSLTSKYEDELAELRAGFTQQLGAMDDLVKSQEADIEKLQEQLRKYQDAEKNQETTTSK